MVTYIPQIEGIVIPILGLCIIFALAVAAYFEPKKDYSRRLYIFMNQGEEEKLKAIIKIIKKTKIKYIFLALS